MERVVEYTLKAKDDLVFLKKSGQSKALKKVRQLIQSILENPSEGIGKPERLKYQFNGYWSRRINKEHRLVYEVQDDKIFIHSVRGHYY